MGKKNLLNEGTITRFMKLAAINENAAQAFVGSIHEEDEDELAADDELAGDELAGDELAGDELAADDELAGDELAADDEVGGEGGTEGAVKDMVDAVVGAISAVADDHGVQVDLNVQGGDDELAGDELAGDELGDELAGDELGDELAGDAELAAPEEEPGLELETQIRSIVAEMLNEDEEDTGASAGDESATNPGEEDYINEEDDADLEESHGRGRRETAQHTGDRTADRGLNESIQIVDDGILVQEVTNRVFTRLHKMLNERKKTK